MKLRRLFDSRRLDCELKMAVSWDRRIIVLNLSDTRMGFTALDMALYWIINVLSWI